MSALAITVVGHDQPGIIARTAAALADLGMNLEDSSMTLLRGHFAMTLICAGDADAATVERALAGLADGSLAVDVRAVPAGPVDAAGPSESFLVTVHGADRLGIVARLTGVVADAGGNITDLTTRLTGELYVLVAELELPAGAAPDALAADLQAVAVELGVGVTLRPVDRDEL